VPITYDSFGIAQDVKINFQPSNRCLPTGYIKDSGDAYDAYRGFGWVAGPHTPLSIVDYARDRDPPNDQRFDTHVPNAPALLLGMYSQHLQCDRQRRRQA